MVHELETPPGADISPVRVAEVERPVVPDVPSEPGVLRNIALGSLIGLLLGGALAMGRARLDRSVKDADQAAELAGAPVIGTVLKDQSLEKRHTVEHGGSTRVAEDYRQLRTNLQFLRVDQPPKVILVTSALPSEGKTTAVVNLGLALAAAGRSVTIVEADLRRPKVTRYLQMVAGVGLTNVLAGAAKLDDVLQAYGDTGMTVLASGPTPPNPGELLASAQMASLVEELRGRSDLVLVDAPPLLPVADASGLASVVDGVLLSVRYGFTRKEQLQQAATTLARVRATTLGVILNIVPPKADVAVASGYGYAYETVDRVEGRRASRRAGHAASTGLPEILR
jgi:capsular exopolysaccharide synthesis family protein